MAKKKPRSTSYFDQSEEGSFEPVVETPRSKFVPIENVPSEGLNPEEICILCEKLRRVTDPALSEFVREIMATYTHHPVPPREEGDGNQFPPLGSETILVARIKEHGSKVKPHRNAPSLAVVSICSLLIGMSDFEVFILESEEEDDY